MTQPVRLAILGLGRWGVHLLRNFLALPEAEVVAVVDPKPEALARVQAQFDLPNTVEILTDWRAALALPGLGGIAIATPATTHYPLIKTALERHLHVLTEKPMTLSGEECQELYALAAQNGRQLIVDHTYLFHPAVQAGQQAVREHRLGALRYGYAARTNLGPVRSDVDALWDLAIHDIAIFNHWVGETPSQVSAWGRIWLQPQTQPLFPRGLADVGWMRLMYPSQVEAVIHVSWLNPDKQRRLALVGDQGTLVFDELAAHPLTLYQGAFTDSEAPFAPTPITPLPLAMQPSEPLARVCRHFLEQIQKKGDGAAPIAAPATGTAAERATAIALVNTLAALSTSLQHGGTPVTISAEA